MPPKLNPKDPDFMLRVMRGEAEAVKVYSALPRADQKLACQLLADIKDPSHPQHAAWQQMKEDGSFESAKATFMSYGSAMPTTDPGLQAPRRPKDPNEDPKVYQEKLEDLFERVNSDPDACIWDELNNNTRTVDSKTRSRKVDINDPSLALRLRRRYRDDEVEDEWITMSREDQRAFIDLMKDRAANPKAAKHKGFWDAVVHDPETQALETQRVANRIGMPIVDMGGGRLVISVADHDPAVPFVGTEELAREMCKRVNANPKAPFHFEFTGTSIRLLPKNWNPATEPLTQPQIHNASPEFQPITYEPEHCPVCDRTGIELIQCAGCFKMHYCSPNCAALDAVEHVKKCTNRCGSCGKKGNMQNMFVAWLEANANNPLFRPEMMQHIANYCDVQVTDGVPLSYLKVLNAGDTGEGPPRECVASVVLEPPRVIATPPDGVHVDPDFKAKTYYPDPSYECKICRVPLSLRLCSGCEKCWYCTTRCQKEDWKRHKAECKRAQAEKRQDKNAGECTKA
ncbi:hypothetical protein BU16DRAFT_556411 [Lophium mytilinum]|uniref:MYND-type domain-containing protein n=1 Tax=Lophium mytilinum TaxID=390894 RepID=A0A6A6R5S7_9PEZI|nr:hypothetical protein BU16DRAFT_556411 [Lophium mytilinum]